jgi:hypothetical protein
MGPRGEGGWRDRGRAVLARWGWLIAIGVAYLYVFPYYPKIFSANELPRVYLVKAIAEEHRFAIDLGVKKWGPTADMSPANGHQYSNKAPGSSMLAAPPYFVVSAIAGPPSLATSMWLSRFFAGIVPALAFLALLARFLARYVPDDSIRRLVLIAYALGSMAMTYSLLFFSHQLGAICVASAWIIALDVADGERSPRAMLIAGALAGAAPLVDYQAVFAAVPVAVHIVVRLVRARPRADIVRAIGLATAGAVVPIAILLWYHATCFGSPWRTGYDASTTFAHFHQQGFLGVTELRWEAFVGSMVRLDNGLIALSPWWLLALPGLVILWRNHRGTALVGASVALIYILFVSSINFWRGGWGVGPRYITAMLPFLLPAVGAALQWLRDHSPARFRWLALGIACASIVIGVVIYSLSSATFPYWPDSLKNPIFSVTFRLFGDNLVARNPATALGLDGIASITPYLAVVIGLVGLAITRVASWRGTIVAVLVATAVIAAYSRKDEPKKYADRAYKFVREAVER